MINIGKNLIFFKYISTDKQLNVYYLPGLDVAHADFLKAMNASGQIIDGKISLHNIAYGVIEYSSICNSEFL